MERASTMHRIVGFDPGLNITGYGIVECHGGSVKLVEAGTVRSRGEALETRRAKAERANDAARLAELDAIEANYDDSTGRLLELLWRTSQEIREQGSPGEVVFEEGVVPVDTSTWWPSASGRVKFRLGEIDFATMREMGES